MLVTTSCHVSRISKKHYEKSEVIETYLSKTQDTSIASLVIKIIDIETYEAIPFASIELKNDQGKILFTSDTKGHVLIPNIEEGEYDLKITFVGYHTLTIEKLFITKKEDIWITVGLLNAVYLAS